MYKLNTLTQNSACTIFSYPQRLMNKLILIWICEGEWWEGASWGKTNSQSQGMQTCKWMWRKPSESAIPSHNITQPALVERERVSLLHAKPPKNWVFSAPLRPTLAEFQSPSKTTSLPARKFSQKSTPSHCHGHAYTASSQGLVVSPVLSVSSHHLNSKCLHQLPLHLS